MNRFGIEGYSIFRADKPLGLKNEGTVYAWTVEEAAKKISDRWDVVNMNEKLMFIEVLPKKKNYTT